MTEQTTDSALPVPEAATVLRRHAERLEARADARWGWEPPDELRERARLVRAEATRIEMRARNAGR